MKDQALADIAKIRPIRAYERALFNDHSHAAHTMKSIMIDQLGKPSQKVLGVISSRGLAIGKIDKPNKSFVLGSRPVLKITKPDVTDLSDQQVEFWLPIAPDIIAGLGLQGIPEGIWAAPDQFVTEFNHATFTQSSNVASRSKELLASLVRAHRH